MINELETIKAQSERIVGDLFEESVEGSPLVPSVPMAAPDTGQDIPGYRGIQVRIYLDAGGYRTGYTLI